MKLEITKHARNDRLDRIMYIAQNVGWGKIVVEYPDTERDVRICLTDTGVIIVKSMDVERLVTAYVGTVNEIKWLYVNVGYNRIPDFMYNKAVKNKKHLPFM